MIEIDIPGYRKLELSHLVLDYNGTLACDGELIPGAAQSLTELSGSLEIHVLTADTFGNVASGLGDIPCVLSILPAGHQDVGKLSYVDTLGAESAVCVGNGRNDRLMLKAAALGIAVILEEGAAAATVHDADVVCVSILSALDLLLNPLRLAATLRS
jgi:soluble P-type ATPase